MALQPEDRPAGSTQVLRFRGTVSAGEALAAFPKTNGTFTTGGAAGATRGVRFLFADATDLTLTQRQFPAFVYDDESPAGLAPHAPVATNLVALVVNANEQAIGHATQVSTDRTWCQNTTVTVKSLSANLGSVDTESALIVLDTDTSGLGTSTGLPVLILPVALLGGAVAPFDIDVLVEVRWSAHRSVVLRVNLIPNADEINKIRYQIRRKKKREYNAAWMREYTKRLKEKPPAEEILRTRREQKRAYAKRYYHEIVKKDPARYAAWLAKAKKRTANWREANPETVTASREKFKPRNHAYRAKQQQKIRDLKKSPCLDCGGRFPVCCMDYDHRDPAEKSPLLKYTTRRVVSMPAALVAEEMAKCDLVCSNCHRIRTAKRLGSPAAEPWWTDGELS